MKLVLPWPPSANQYWRHPTKGPLAGRHLISTEGRSYRREVIARVLEQGARKMFKELLQVEVLAFVPDRRRRDLGNLEKALFDSLTHAGVWVDDCQVDELRFRRARDSKGELVIGNRIEITIKPLHAESSGT